MYHPLDRRNFLKAGAALGAGIGLAGLGGAAAEEAPAKDPHASAEKLGWRLGCQAYTFNRYTFFEAIDKTHGLGLRYIEGFPQAEDLERHLGLVQRVHDCRSA